jgi:galactonate dehydratase
MDRRAFFRTAGLAAAGMPFGMGLAPENVWGAIPKGIKITGVDTFLVEGNCCFVKIRTNEGITGLGEGSISDNRAGTIATIIKELEGHLVGRDPTNIEYLWQGIYRWNRWHAGVLFSTAISAIDIALWDILGKLAGLPIYKLLGGAARDKVRLYTAGSGIKGVQYAKSIGCNAIKTGPPITMAGDNLTVPLPWDLKRAVKQIEEMRIEGGDDFDILTDLHGRLNPAMALEYCKAIEPYRVFWAEEPIQVEGSNDALEWLSDHTTVPLCMGERNFMKWGFEDIISRHIVSYLNPDVVHCGGISEMKKIAAMAEAQFIQISPHITYSRVGILAELHIGMNCPNSVIQEMSSYAADPFRTKKDWRDDLFHGHTFAIRDGFATLPDTPGLGLELNEEVAKAHPYKTILREELRFEDGSVEDN